MRRTMTMRRAGVAIALPLALALTACGADDGDSVAKDESSATSGKSAEEPGDGAESPLAETDPDATETEAETESDATQVGAVDKGEKLTPEEFAQLVKAAFSQATTAKITLSSTAGDMETTSEGVIDLSGDTPEMQMSMANSALSADQRIDLRLIGEAIYMNMGTFSGGKFIKMDLGEASATGLDLDQIDPSKTVDQFEKAATTVTYQGVEKVDGESLHRYDLTLDPQRMDLPKESMPKSIDYDVWFDDAGFVRRVSMTMGKVASTEVTYSDWGKPVKITAPAAADVMEMPTQPKSRQG